MSLLPARILLTVLTVATVAVACVQPRSDSCAACADGPADKPSTGPILAIREAAAAVTIDGLLAEWPQTHRVLEITAGNASNSQWLCIRDRCPAPISAHDIGVSAYLAWGRDPLVLYAAFDIADETVAPSPDPDHPYGGDSIELFLAAADLTYPRDYHELVEAPRRVAQSAFAQIDITPVPFKSLGHYLQDYRTDSSFKAFIVARNGLAVATRRSDAGWQAELMVPLDAFMEDIASRMKSDGASFAIGIQYLDYDDPGQLPNPALKAHSYGFRPANVFSAAPRESVVIVPAHMQRAYLAR